MEHKKYALYIGRYQSPHKGHMSIFDQSLNQGKSILIAIRDIDPDDKNPLWANEVKELWEKVYEGNNNVKVIIIPDIESVNYGRGVGYEVNQIQVPDNIANISATDIRSQIWEGKQDWKNSVDSKIHNMLEEKIKSKEKVK